MTKNTRSLSGAAFATLLLIALMMGANHVAARIAFNHGADVATAVVFRSGTTALVLLVEWPEKAEGRLNAADLALTLDYAGPDARKLVAAARSPAGQAVLSGRPHFYRLYLSGKLFDIIRHDPEREAEVLRKLGLQSPPSAGRAAYRKASSAFQTEN